MRYMLSGSESEIAREWEKYKGYTVRPLNSTIDYYQQQISAYTAKHKFLVYGGTPEIRSIFQDFQYDVTIIDKSSQMIRAMGQLTHDGMPLAFNERFIELDWLDLYSINTRFDLVIGDDAINMVDINSFDLFLQNTAHVLNENGVFICHLLVKPDDELINQSFEEIIQLYYSGEIPSVYDLASRLNFICYDRKSGAMGWQQTITQIGVDKLISISSDFHFIDIFGLCNSKFYCPFQADFEDQVQQYFTIEEIFYPHEHDYCLYEPVYLLKKKRN